MSSAPLQTLDRKLKRIQTLESVSGLLGWDELVNLPPESADQRAEQSAALAQVCHNASVDPELGQVLADLEAQIESLDASDQIVLKEARKDYDRAARLPEEYVDRKARLDSAAYHAWARARADSDFAQFAPFLQQQLDAAREFAEHLGWGDRAYDCHIDLHDPGMDTATIAALFSELKTELAPIVERILNSNTKPDVSIFKGFPIEAQSEFLKTITSDLGFDYQRGRIDVSLHPFCSGNGADTRMTTRFDADNPLDSLFSAIHETGHGLYEQGLPRDQLHTALGKAAGMGAHESQSRLWENQVCRSRAFWNRYESDFRERFPSQLENVSSDALYLAINSVSRNPIRVDSDEVTYNLHIIIRFELEQRLFDGSLSANDLPEAWNALYKELLDITPRNDAEGVLQDVHWSGGAFGYFPSYCLGNLLAAQLWYAALEQLPELEADFERGEFTRLLEWLRTNVHAHGKRLPLNELAVASTGSPLSTQALVKYLEDRYLPLYS